MNENVFWVVENVPKKTFFVDAKKR